MDKQTNGLYYFEKSKRKNKKYDAVFPGKGSKPRRVSFGDTRYQHYYDSTGLNLYSHLNHLDLRRKRLYQLRHERTSKKKYSPSWFALNYLWS